MTVAWGCWWCLMGRSSTKKLKWYDDDDDVVDVVFIVRAVC